ncbi:trypsin eta-like [Teleopsis dalmanni]|uniref:trypsin eta-like n=1 Tax=Teleopsis dalmanni TaxID=139649 RepID=UPI0018CDF586|nr:trypsin eta-like [Teleopsis dalmanni]
MIYQIQTFFFICLIVVFTTSQGYVLAENKPTGLQQRILDGLTTTIFKHAYLVSIRKRFSEISAYEHYCSGSIYSANIILTTASCVRNTNPSNIKVITGTSYSSGAAQDGAMHTVREVALHTNDSIDIALLHLGTNITLNGFNTKAISLAKELPKTGKMGVVAGWGKNTEIGTISENLREINVPTMDQAACKAYYFWHSITDTEVCAGYVNGGVDACQGDAGSPLLVDGKVIGIVSWGYGCGRKYNPGVYTNVVRLVDWIEQNAAVTNEILM